MKLNSVVSTTASTLQPLVINLLKEGQHSFSITVVARVVVLSVSIFRLYDLLANFLLGIAKLALFPLRKMGVRSFSSDRYSINSVSEHFKEAGRAALGTLLGSASCLFNPSLISEVTGRKRTAIEPSEVVTTSDRILITIELDDAVTISGCERLHFTSFFNLSKETGQEVSSVEDVHSQIGKPFFEWARTQSWSDERIDTEYSRRVLGLVQDLKCFLGKLEGSIQIKGSYSSHFKYEKEIQTTFLHVDPFLRKIAASVATQEVLTEQALQSAEIHDLYDASSPVNNQNERVPYPPVVAKLQESILELNKETLLEVQEAFEKAGVVSWVDAGSLLGIYRHGGKQMPQDYDCDLSILHRDAFKAAEVLQSLAQEKPEKYNFSDLAHDNNPGRFMRLWVREGCRDGRQAWLGIESYLIDPHASKDKQMSMCYQDDALENVFPLRRVHFYDQSLWAPREIETHLQKRYDNLEPISYWVEEKQSLVLDLDHPLAEGERKKIDSGKVPGVYIPSDNEHKRWKNANRSQG
ncbi:LicD family protein [Simkania negevensis]|uniref:LicD family protein n=1 Tax=Simkania negevensis TaxID=83561 RepID=A0ABS3ASM5_9BACT|nr:LicD family protein [Simkania negevensis]